MAARRYLELGSIRGDVALGASSDKMLHYLLLQHVPSASYRDTDIRYRDRVQTLDLCVLCSCRQVGMTQSH